MKKNKKKGFSLVELIVVLAIMAVMVAVLAPSLLSYVERSRAQKDDSAMGELTNVIRLALADEKVYDAAVLVSYNACPSCYIDKESEAECSDQLVIWKNTGDYETSQWTYNDDARLADEEIYKFAGKMRGFNITFHPLHIWSGYSEVHFDEVSCNEIWVKPELGASDSYFRMCPSPDYYVDFYDLTNESQENKDLGLRVYGYIKSAVGDSIRIDSHTYRFSSYTVFVKIGSVVSADPSNNDAIQVYGQWNGTNLMASEQWWQPRAHDHAGYAGAQCGD